MQLTLERHAFKPNYTIGRLYIDGSYFCDTLEDCVRDEKIYGKTAIPKGVYVVSITYSQRFKRLLPLLENVPNFSGIRIHPGNTAEDTHGCILVGKNDKKGRVSASKATFELLFARLKTAELIKIEVVNVR